MNFKSAVRIVLAVLTTNIHFSSNAQPQTSGIQFYSDLARDLQDNGYVNPLLSFCVRPVYNTTVFYPDSINGKDFAEKLKRFDSMQSSKRTILLPVQLNQQYNSHHPYGWNDGSMIPAKGYQTQLSFGVFLKKGIISLQLNPELVFAQNSSFSQFPIQQKDSIWRSYYNTLINKIDAPDRLGSGSYFRIFPGQSGLRFNYGNLSLGVSTENLWWGPGLRNSLLMSNNAPGFPHLSFNSIQPVISSVGSFEWQLISGQLKGSGILPDTTLKFNGQPLYQPKPDGDRYLNGMVITWQPKWTKGLFVGFSRVFYQYTSDVRSSFDGYVPVFGKFFKGGLSNDDAKKRDQMLSFFLRLLLPEEKAELYAEYGRNDHSQNANDFLLEPEHSRAYIIGFSKTFETPKTDVRLFGEITNLQIPSTSLLRPQESWYTHYQVRHGYTNYGQVMGAGIGPGSSSQTIGLQWGKAFNKFGGMLERVVHNNDFYYNAFAPIEQWQKHWVDISLNLNKSWARHRIVYDAKLSFINAMNYQWYYKNVFSISARLGVSYLF
ncbi:MAG TPA: capsule assembly Wzi family protein [Flavisolibacter sp.]|jgi:hypothetical protein|nr:capsule assembly Wzi family protein [Flavisolibacter sp.]